MKAKRIIAILLALLVSLSLFSACQGPETTPEREETTAEPTTGEPETTAPNKTEQAETTPSETDPPETDSYVPVRPEDLHFQPEDYPVIDGSTATKPLAKAFQEALTGEKGVEINHSKTGKAYTKLVDGEADLILVVEPSEDNKAYADEKKVTLKLSKVANEGFVFFVNKRNPVNSLTADQIRKIYSGEITNWKEVGGLDAEIVAFQRPVNSGSQTGMESIVMGDTPLMEPVTGKIADTMSDIIDAISTFDGGENAIGYSYYYYANTMYLGENIKMIAVDGIVPNNTTICDMEYPFLTAYYAVTRKGDETDRTKDLLNYMLSEYGQRNVLESGYVPIFDVGSAPADGKGASDERTLHLSDTYDEAGIRFRTVTEKKGKHDLTYGQIDGLLDQGVQEKINKTLREEAEKALEEALKKNGNKGIVTVSSSLSSAVSDTLSVRILAFVSTWTDISSYRPVNLRLADGERITWNDLFKSDTEGKEIFNSGTYAEILSQIGETGGMGPNYHVIIDDYHDVEDLMLDLIQSFDAREEVPFTFQADSFTVVHEVDQKVREINIQLAPLMEQVTIFNKYVSETDLYTGEYPRVKGIPVLVNRYNESDGFFERGDDYLLNLTVIGRYDIPDEHEEAREAFCRFYERRLSYVRALIEEARKEGKFILIENGFGTAWSDEPQFIGRNAEQYQFNCYSRLSMLTFDNREEFEKASDLVISYMRTGVMDATGPGNIKLMALGWLINFHEDGSYEQVYQVKERSGGLFLFKDCSELRPYVEGRISLENLRGKTGEEAFHELKEKELELPPVYAKKGNEASVVNMVVEEILEHPERLTERNWTYQDIFLLEAADRIADCLKP